MQSKVNIPVAEYRSSVHDISSQHVTTSDFMQFSVAKALEIVPNQSIDIQHSLFTRLEPLPVPTFGRARIHNKCYFVPYFTIFDAWHDFITDTAHVFKRDITSLVPNVPYSFSSSFIEMFCDPNFSTFVSDDEEIIMEESTDHRKYDFSVYFDSSESFGAYKFTNLGRRVYKLLLSLGYKFTFNTLANEPMSLMPLFAALRVYLDFYYPSQYSVDEDAEWIKSLFICDNLNRLEDEYLDAGELKRVFTSDIFSVVYNSDYITQSWDNPISPNDNTPSSSFNIHDVTSLQRGEVHYGDNAVYVGESYSDNLNSNTPIIAGENGSVTGISKYILTALGSLSDYLKRHQLAGSRVIDRYLARFGVRPTIESLKRSYKVGEFYQDIQFGDVTSTSDTSGANLGAYAGKGISYGNGHYTLEAQKEYGMLIVISTIIPETQYFEGINRHCYHLSKLDFYTPEFDALGVQPLKCTEVYNPNDGILVDDSNRYNEMIFSFVPRYAEYKVPYSQITGDYVLNSMNAGKDSWTLFRSIKPYFTGEGVDAFVHTKSFVLGNDASQFNRIFYNTDDTADHFNIILELIGFVQ